MHRSDQWSAGSRHVHGGTYHPQMEPMLCITAPTFEVPGHQPHLILFKSFRGQKHSPSIYHYPSRSQKYIIQSLKPPLKFVSGPALEVSTFVVLIPM